MLITALNDDELIIIFKFCTELDRRALQCVCRKFERIIEENFNEFQCRNLLMVSHIKSYPELFQRTLNGYLKYSERLRLYQNWMYGTFSQQIVFFQHRENFRTFIELDGENLYTASLGEFNIFQRKLRYGIDVNAIFTAGIKSDSHITSLVRKADMVAGSRANGSIFAYTDIDGYNLEFISFGPDPINSLDFHNDLFVTSTRHETTFSRLGLEMGMMAFDLLDLNVNRGFDNVAFSPGGRKILATNSGDFELIDPASGASILKYQGKLQIFTTKWIDENSFIYTSWNSPLCLIDCRMEIKKQDFFNSFTASAVCHDGRFSVIYGTLLGMMLLCDLRKTNTFERVYHLDTPAVCRSIITDENHMYVGTDNAIHFLNFN